MVASWKTTWLRIETAIGRNPVIGWVFHSLHAAQIGPAKWPWNTQNGALGRARHWPFQYSADSRSAWMVPGWLWRRLPATIHKKKSNGEKCDGWHLVSTRIVFPYLSVCLKIGYHDEVPPIPMDHDYAHENDVTWITRFSEKPICRQNILGKHG